MSINEPRIAGVLVPLPLQKKWDEKLAAAEPMSGDEEQLAEVISLDALGALETGLSKVFCISCGKQITEEFCPDCGYPHPA